MTHRTFTRVLSVLLVLAIVAVLTLALTGDAISDFLFGLPAWVPIAFVVGYLAVIVLVVALCTAADRGDRMAAARRDVTDPLDGATWEWPENVHRLPQRAPAEVVPFPTDRGTA